MTNPRLKHGWGASLVRSTFANILGQALLFLASFFSSPYIIHHFGEALYGVYVLLTSYVVLFSILELGVNASLAKYIAEELPRGRVHEVNGYLGTALVLFSAAAIFTGLFSYALSKWIVVHILNVPGALTHSAILGLRLASIAFALQFISQAFSSIPIAAHRFDIVNFIEVGTDLLRVIGIVLAIFFGFSLVTAMAVILACSLLRMLIFAVTCKVLVPGVSILPKFSKPHFLAIAHFSKFLIVGKVVSRLVESSDKFLIGHFYPLAFVSFYAVPYALGQKLWILAGNLTTVVFPAASALQSLKDEERLRELYWRSSKMVCATVVFPGLALCIVSRRLLTYWIGHDFALHSSLIMQLLMLAFTFNALSHVPQFVCQAVGRPDLYARFSTAYLVVNLSLFAALIPHFGALGAAVAFLTTQLLLVPWYIRVSSHLLNVRTYMLLSKAYLPIVIATTPACLLIWGLLQLANSLLGVIAVMSAGTAVYAVLAFFFILDHRERAACLAAVRQSAANPSAEVTNA